jgi:hypothetical protein
VPTLRIVSQIKADYFGETFADQPVAINATLSKPSRAAQWFGLISSTQAAGLRAFSQLTLSHACRRRTHSRGSLIHLRARRAFDTG